MLYSPGSRIVAGHYKAVMDIDELANQSNLRNATCLPWINRALPQKSQGSAHFMKDYRCQIRILVMSLSAMRSARLAADGLLVNPAPFKLRTASHATAIVAVPTGALSALDNADLARCEKVINAGLTTFFEVGRALLTIKIKQLYRRDCATFEEYCRKRWDMSRFYAYRLINAAEVRQRLLTIGNIPLPKNEAQARPLTRLTPDLVPKVWRKAVEMANGEEVSQKHVAQAARQVQEASQRRKPLNGKTTHTQDSHSVVLACRMMREMRKCLLAGETEQALFTLEKLKLTLERMAADSKRGVEDEGSKHDS